MIKAYVIDDELAALQELNYLLEEVGGIEVAGLFQNPLDALRRIKDQKPEVVFLDIDMPNMNGIELALKIQSLQEGIIIIFVTAYADYSLDAFKAYPLDYILKPVDDVRFRQTVEHILEQCMLRQMASRDKSQISILCFGRLEVVKYGKPNQYLKLSNRKIKELLAYLITHFDKLVTKKELLQLLFNGVEDKKTVNHLHVTAYNLRNILINFGIDQSLVLIKENYSLGIAPGICGYVDFVNFMNNHITVDATNVVEAERIIELYKGDYLEGEDYIWAIEIREC